MISSASLSTARFRPRGFFCPCSSLDAFGFAIFRDGCFGGVVFFFFGATVDFRGFVLVLFDGLPRPAFRFDFAPVFPRRVGACTNIS